MASRFRGCSQAVEDRAQEDPCIAGACGQTAGTSNSDCSGKDDRPIVRDRPLCFARLLPKVEHKPYSYKCGTDTPEETSGGGALPYSYHQIEKQNA